MQVVRVHEAVLERIGHTIGEVIEDVTTEPLPPPIVGLLNEAQRLPAQKGNVICALMDALTQHESYQFFERNGELFIVRAEERLPGA